MKTEYLIILVYLIIINIIAAVFTIQDKKFAKKHQWRISENTLMIISLLGGSPAMYLTMKIIRHKTRHPKFMIGIPVILITEIILIFLLVR